MDIVIGYGYCYWILLLFIFLLLLDIVVVCYICYDMNLFFLKEFIISVSLFGV